MPRCCSGASCACAIQAGPHIQIAGTGSAQDPFVLAADVSVEVLSTTDFDLAMTGTGTEADPWILQVSYAPTSILDHIPDVNAPTPSNGDVLGFDTTTHKWTNRAPTTAASGSVLHDTSLAGDGSSGSHLAVVEDPAGYLETTAAGIAIDDDGQNQMVLHYASDLVRSVATITPQINSLSMLDDTPGVTWYWTGTQWLPVTNGINRDFGTLEFLAMSGDYDGGVTTLMVRQIATTTNADGTFDVLSSIDLTGAAGVLSCVFQEAGVVPFKALINGNLDSIQGTAYRIDDGTALGSQAISGVAVAYIY